MRWSFLRYTTYTFCFLGTSKQPEYDIKFLFGFQTLDFDLIVYAPYRSIEGFIDDLEVRYMYLFCTANHEVQLLMLYFRSSMAFAVISKRIPPSVPNYSSL